MPGSSRSRIIEGTWRLLPTVAAFTAARSIALALAALGFVRALQAPAEAVIASSIVFVAAEIVHHLGGVPSLRRGARAIAPRARARLVSGSAAAGRRRAGRP